MIGSHGKLDETKAQSDRMHRTQESTKKDSLESRASTIGHNKDHLFHPLIHNLYHLCKKSWNQNCFRIWWDCCWQKYFWDLGWIHNNQIAKSCCGLMCNLLMNECNTCIIKMEYSMLNSLWVTARTSSKLNLFWRWCSSSKVTF